MKNILEDPEQLRLLKKLERAIYLSNTRFIRNNRLSKKWFRVYNKLFNRRKKIFKRYQDYIDHQNNLPSPNSVGEWLAINEKKNVKTHLYVRKSEIDGEFEARIKTGGDMRWHHIDWIKLNGWNRWKFRSEKYETT